MVLLTCLRKLWLGIRWWYWLLSGPVIGDQIVRGWDKQTRDVIFERWEAREPK